jgi:hypothetical protein
MSTAFQFPLAVCALASVLAAAVPARADENVLHGPHPFLDDNELSAHVLLATGGAHTPGGTKLGFDYGYRLQGPAWLNLQLNSQFARCQQPTGATTCDGTSGAAFETLVGVKLKWATAIPVVPYVKGGAGLVFVFPDGAPNGAGVALRAGGGANYFFFDWLGVGGEIGVSFGHVSYPHASASYSVLDFGGGLEFQF